MPLEKRDIDDLFLLRMVYTVGATDTVADTVQTTPLEGPFDLTRIHVINEESSTPDQVKYLFVYDTAGTPVVGTSRTVLQFEIPQETSGSNKGVTEIVCDDGMTFESGLAFAIGFTNADTGTTDISGAENDVVTVSFYGRT